MTRRFVRVPQQRQLMFFGMTLLTAAVISAKAVAAAPLIKTYLTIGPVRSAPADPPYGPGDVISPSYAAWAANTLGALLDGESQRGGSIGVTPTAFDPLKRRYILDGEALAFENSSVWRGNFNPAAAFANESGTFTRVPVSIVESTPFTAAEVSWSFRDNFGANDVEPLSTVAGYFRADRAIGVYWGADGKPGGGDDIVYSDPSTNIATTLVNQLAFVGVGEAFVYTQAAIDSDYGGSAKAAYADDLFAVSGGYGDAVPFYQDIGYSLRGVESDIEYKILASVPEPEMWTMVIVGFGVVGTALRRRREPIPTKPPAEKVSHE